MNSTQQIRPVVSRGTGSVLIPFLLVVSVLVPVLSDAHPLGNYSINQYFRVDLRGSEFKIFYQIDIAEIPSFREMDLLDGDADEVVTRAEISAYLDRRVPEFRDNLKLIQDGTDVAMRLAEYNLRVLEGSGGLPVFNIEMEFVVDEWSIEGPSLLELQSENFEKARGYRECYVLLDGRYEIATGPWTEGELRYLTLVLEDDDGNPLFQSFYNKFRLELSDGTGDAQLVLPETDLFDWTATARSDEKFVVLAQGGTRISRPVATAKKDLGEASAQTDPALDRTPAPAISEAAESMLGRVSEVIRSKELTAPMMLFSLAIAMVLGMGHAFSPGHGKTVMAAYLIGERGTVKHAVILGSVVTLTHVWSVLLLGLVTLYAGERFTEESITFWTGIASGLIIVAIGAILFVNRYRSFVLAKNAGAHDHHHHRDHAHDHEHDHTHDHHHAHDHGDEQVHSHGLFGKPHSHVVEGAGGAPPTYKNIIWLGISGGIVPCPAALIVLLLAIKFGRLMLGLWLILAFSVGLASVLVAIGIAVVRASGQIRKRIGERSPLLLALPVVSSILITFLGAWIVLWTLMQFNVIMFRPGG